MKKETFNLLISYNYAVVIDNTESVEEQVGLCVQK